MFALTQWCIRDKGLMALVKKKQKRRAQVGTFEPFSELPDKKKDLCLRLKHGQHAVNMHLVVASPYEEEVQRCLCRLGSRTYHVSVELPMHALSCWALSLCLLMCMLSNRHTCAAALPLEPLHLCTMLRTVLRCTMTQAFHASRVFM